MLTVGEKKSENRVISGLVLPNLQVSMISFANLQVKLLHVSY